MRVSNAPELYTSALIALQEAPQSMSRAGRVKALATPQLITVDLPWQRVVYHPERKANPYFHVMETVWMFAGAQEVEFLLDFNQRMADFAEIDGKINGAYGHRWRNHFQCRDQLMWLVDELQRDPDTRQAVVAMYDPVFDHEYACKDRPCNTHLYFRRLGNQLDMTVCNRSNDAVWGLAGANIVHMTYLHELIAAELGMKQGRYHVLTNNLHIYERHWPLLERPYGYDWYSAENLPNYPVFNRSEQSMWEFLLECEQFVRCQTDVSYKSSWINNVVIPMYEHYMCRLNGDKDTYDIRETKDAAWRRAEEEWREWHRG